MLKRFIGTAALALVAAAAQAGLTVAPVGIQASDANTLVNTINGPGIAVVPGSAVLTGFAGQAGTFTGGNSVGLGFDSGIILSSGRVSDAVGPNDSGSTSTGFGGGGDGDLQGIATGTVFDAVTLSFDFVSTGGDLFFNFVFASEEYNEFVNLGVNDVFGFFLDGVNIALIPNTNTPVSIDTVNLNANSTFYRNNSPGPFDIEYDGLTTVLTAQALGLTAGSHTIKLAIGDVGDNIYDSSVFLQAGSFSDNPTDPAGAVPEPGTLALLTLGGLGFVGRAVRRRKAAV